MDELPEELRSAIKGLEHSYKDFECHPGGANGYVVFATNRVTAAEVAIKFYYGASGERRHDEPRLLASIESPNVLPILDARHLSEEWAYFLTKRCGDGDLDQFITTRPSARRAIDVALGIFTGVSSIHAHALIHRDLKPANVVLHEGVPLIADFGSVRQIVEGESDIPASGHSALYRPPESFETGRYGLVGDVYQLGLVAYQLLGGALPYEPMDHFSARDFLEYKLVANDFERSLYQDGVIHRKAVSATLIDMKSLPPWVKGNAKKVIRSMTHPDVSQRIANVADVAAALTQVRAETADWRWVDDIARLQMADRVVELRPKRNGAYEPMQAKGDAFRRVPSMPDGLLRDLVDRFR
ncbi:MAG: protein kinase domain-containing protein [Alphaproteobacteria bacterium]